jgi:hypothetical protein
VSGPVSSWLKGRTCVSVRERKQVLTPFFLHKPAVLFAQSEPHAKVRQANPMNPHVEVKS